MKDNNKTYDLALVGGTILTMDDDNPIIQNGIILIKSGFIEFIGRKEKAPEYIADKTINTNGRHILPAFFNQHTHLSLSLYRGLGTDLSLLDWLQKAIWPLEKAFSTPENIHLGSLLSLVEMIKNGVGCLADMDFHSLFVGKAVQEAGIRAFLGEGIFDNASPSSGSPEESFEYSREMIKEYTDSELISIYLAPHAPFSCSPELYEKIGRMAHDLGIPVGSHVSETKHEVNLIKEKYGLSPIALLDRSGVLDDHFIAFHVVHPEDNDIDILASKGVSVIHNPHSNMVLGSGLCPVNELQQKGIKVGLGTDSAASNNHLSMLREMQTAYLIHKGANYNAKILPSKQVLEMATKTGYEIYRMDKLGKISQGYKADIQIIDLNSIHNQPVSDIYSSLVSSAKPKDIKSLIVNGKIIMEDRKILTIDEEIIKLEAKKFGSKTKDLFPHLFNENEKEVGDDQ